MESLPLEILLRLTTPESFVPLSLVSSTLSSQLLSDSNYIKVCRDYYSSHTDIARARFLILFSLPPGDPGKYALLELSALSSLKEVISSSVTVIPRNYLILDALVPSVIPKSEIDRSYAMMLKTCRRSATNQSLLLYLLRCHPQEAELAKKHLADNYYDLLTREEQVTCLPLNGYGLSVMQDLGMKLTRLPTSLIPRLKFVPFGYPIEPRLWDVITNRNSKSYQASEKWRKKLFDLLPEVKKPVHLLCRRLLWERYPFIQCFMSYTGITLPDEFWDKLARKTYHQVIPYPDVMECSAKEQCRLYCTYSRIHLKRKLSYGRYSGKVIVVPRILRSGCHYALYLWGVGSAEGAEGMGIVETSEEIEMYKALSFYREYIPSCSLTKYLLIIEAPRTMTVQIPHPEFVVGYEYGCTLLGIASKHRLLCRDEL